MQSQGGPVQCDVRGADRLGPEVEAQTLPVMPSRGLIRHEWRKHGYCSGLGPSGYFSRAVQAFRGFRIPRALGETARTRQVPSSVLRDEVLAENPHLDRASVRLACENGDFDELRVCLTNQLRAHPCGTRVRDTCPSVIQVRGLSR